jgi:hypothetical protein
MNRFEDDDARFGYVYRLFDQNDSATTMSIAQDTFSFKN